jgi:steroid 5-alpha reductase family enzyme
MAEKRTELQETAKSTRPSAFNHYQKRNNDHWPFCPIKKIEDQTGES